MASLIDAALYHSLMMRHGNQPCAAAPIAFEATAGLTVTSDDVLLKLDTMKHLCTHVTDA